MKFNGSKRWPQNLMTRSKSSVSITPRFPRSISKDVVLHEIGAITNYYDIDRPVIDQQRRNVIEQKLQMDKIAQKRTKLRLKQNTSYLRYSLNPFTNVKNTSVMKRDIDESQMQVQGKFDKIDAQTIQFVGCLDTIVDMKDKLRNQGINDKFYRNVRNNDVFDLYSKKLSEDQKVVNVKRASRKNSTQQISIQTKQITFDEILRLPDKSYWAQNQKQINIFEFMKGNMKGIFNSDILIQNRFNFTSCVQKFQRIKFPIFRDLSKLGRDLIRNQAIPNSVRLDLLNSNELTFKSNDIRILDIFGVSSGRLTPKLVYNIIISGDAQKSQSPKSSVVQEQDAIYYKDGLVNRNMNFNLNRNEQQENIDYLKLQNTPNEQKYQKKYERISKNTHKNLKTSKELYKNTIKEKPLHNYYKQIVKQDMNILLYLNPKSSSEMDKKIRQNKMNKNRQQRLKIKELLKSVKITNQYQQQIQQLLKGRQIGRR